MPKVASSKSSSSTPKSASWGTNPHVLKRHQACHQCRKRKMKCDAKRPCSGCIRSHAYTVLHAGPGSQLPSHPECTFDEVAELLSSSDEVDDERYTVLENKIVVLETILRNRGGGSEEYSSTSSSRESSDQPQASTEMQLQAQHAMLPITSSKDQGNIASELHFDFFELDAAFDSVPHEFLGKDSSYVPGREGFELSWSNWPPNLPSLPLLQQFARAFFTFHMHAHRLLHEPTFMAALTLPPVHSEFPLTSLLHAICAIGVLYTSMNAPSSGRQESRQLGHSDHHTVFANQQARYAKQLVDENNGVGHNLVQHLQTLVLLTWFYWRQGRWIDVYTQTATTLRIAVTMGLNMCPPFQCISQTMRPASLVPQAPTVFEDELRRNAFWIAYALERQYGCGNGWALSLDDQDVYQMLPVPSHLYESGDVVNLEDRQWSHSPDILLIHPAEYTDSFSIYIKSVILLSRVKTFQLRYRAKHYSNDPALPIKAFMDKYTADSREAPEFIVLQSIAESFRGSFPPHLKDPIMNGTVDPYIFSAITVPHIVWILLHEPFAMVGKASCVSGYRIITASRAILNDLYKLNSTSYNISRLGPFPMFAWFMAGRVLTRFLKAAQGEKAEVQIASLEPEIAYIAVILRDLGNSEPLAFRYSRMLDDHIVKLCGKETASRIGSMNAEDYHGPSFAVAPELLDGDFTEEVMTHRQAARDAIKAMARSQ